MRTFGKFTGELFASLLEIVLGSYARTSHHRAHMSIERFMKPQPRAAATPGISQSDPVPGTPPASQWQESSMSRASPAPSPSPHPHSTLATTGSPLGNRDSPSTPAKPRDNDDLCEADVATRASAGTDTAQQRVPTDTTSTDPNATPTLVAALSMNALAMHDAATAGLDDDDFGFDDDCTWSQLVVNPGGSVRPQTPAASVTAAAEPAASKPGPAVPPPKRKRRVLRQHGTDTSVISHQSCHSQDKTKHVLEPINDEDRGEVEVIVLEDLPEPVVDKTTIPPEKRPPSVMPCTYGSCVTAPEVMVRSQERILETLPPGWLKTAILMSEKGPHKPTIKLTTTCSGCDELPALLCCLLDTVHRMGNVPIDQRREVEQPLACEKVEWKQDHIQNKPDDSPWPIKPQQLVADCWHLASTKTVSAHNAHAHQYAHALVTSEIAKCCRGMSARTKRSWQIWYAQIA